ncbi:MAG: hypothetical protein ACOC54_04055 [Candidatus Sumerlaeota bacterium]
MNNLLYRFTKLALAVCAMLILCVFAADVRAAPSADPNFGRRVAPPESGSAKPRIWIFMGHPGDKVRMKRYGETIEKIDKTLEERFGYSSDEMTILFGEGGFRSYQACNRENLEREMDRMARLSQDGRPIWIFFFGHSNSTRTGVNFNVPGSDPSSRDLGRALDQIPLSTPVTVFMTTAAAGKYLRHFALPGRMVVCADAGEGKDNEPEFPHALAETLEDGMSDTNQDGYLSVLEIFNETKRRVEEIYKEEELIQNEKALLDGDGDGRGTSLPAKKDAEPAEERKIKIESTKVFI